MRHYSLPFGRMIDHEHPHSKRTAYRSTSAFGDCYLQVWTNRAAMARSIRIQQTREHRHDDWHALVKLSDGEGY